MEKATKQAVIFQLTDEEEIKSLSGEKLEGAVSLHYFGKGDITVTESGVIKLSCSDENAKEEITNDYNFFAGNSNDKKDPSRMDRMKRYIAENNIPIAARDEFYDAFQDKNDNRLFLCELDEPDPEHWRRF